MNEDDTPHIPVMLAEAMAQLAPKAGEHHADLTFGAGGYTGAMLATGARVTAFDRDPDAIAAGRALEAGSDGKLRLVEAAFSTLADHCEPASLDGVVLDAGVSSMQIDQALRGFSFRHNGPLDMRMGQAGLSATDVVNRFAVPDLIRIIGILGEEKNAPRIARAIEKARLEAPIETTRHLVSVIENVCPRKPTDRIHPATRTFQGLRIFVNDELNELARALFAAETCLKPGGRLVVVSFHSLEDRIVKRFIQDRSSQPATSRHMPLAQAVPLVFAVKGKPAITVSDQEADTNPRARSARLRHAQRLPAAARSADLSIFGLPDLPWPGAPKAAPARTTRGTTPS